MRQIVPQRAAGFSLLAIAFSFLSCGGGDTLQPPPAKGWTVVWSDEFNGADGSAPDSSKWIYDLGGKGWGNSELECYTNRLQNAQIKGGHLVTTAQQDGAPFACSDRSTNNYTSARLKTPGLFSQAYGRLEALIKLPAAPGLEPAFTWTRIFTPRLRNPSGPPAAPGFSIILSSSFSMSP